MATKKRRTTRRKTARRSTSHAAANPAPRRRRRTTSAAATTHYSSSRPRRRNPSRRRSVRRRNPAHSTGMLSQGLELAAAAALVQFTLGFVPPIGGVSPLADAARTAGTGWLLSTAMNKTGVARRYANSVALAGFTLAGGKLISSFLLPFANRLFASRGPQQQPSNGVSGIALTTAIPPSLVPAPRPVAQQNGVNGISAVPGRYAR